MWSSWNKFLSISERAKCDFSSLPIANLGLGLSLLRPLYYSYPTNAQPSTWRQPFSPSYDLASTRNKTYVTPHATKRWTIKPLFCNVLQNLSRSTIKPRPPWSSSLHGTPKQSKIVIWVLETGVKIKMIYLILQVLRLNGLIQLYMPLQICNHHVLHVMIGHENWR